MCHLCSDYTEQTTIGPHEIAFLSTNQSIDKHWLAAAIKTSIVINICDVQTHSSQNLSKYLSVEFRTEIYRWYTMAVNLNMMPDFMYNCINACL